MSLVLTRYIYKHGHFRDKRLLKYSEKDDNRRPTSIETFDILPLTINEWMNDEWMNYYFNNKKQDS